MSDLLERIRVIARANGYSVGVHGSQKRDLDLIAAPWTPEAVSAWALVDAICEELELTPSTPEIDKDLLSSPEAKPWGRLAWALLGVSAREEFNYVDLSVMPRAGEAVPLRLADDRSMVLSLELRRRAAYAAPSEEPDLDGSFSRIEWTAPDPKETGE